MNRIVSILVIVGLTVLCHAHEMRTWTAMNGSTMEAAFIKYEEPNVHMQKRDGTILKVNRDNLSDEDWIYVMQFDPSIFSLWISLGEPTQRDLLYLKEGKLPPILNQGLHSSFYFSTDEKVCFQSVWDAASGWCYSVTFPVDSSFFSPNTYLKRKNWQGMHFYKSYYYDTVNHQIVSLQNETFLKQSKSGDFTYSGHNEKRDGLVWVCDLDMGSWGFGVVNLKFSNNSVIDLRSKSHSEQNEAYHFSISFRYSSLDSFSALERAYQKREESFMKIPRYRRIVERMKARNVGVPKEALIPPAAKNLTSTGSGFFISQDGYFLTNYHVVKGSQKIQLMTSAGIVKARVVRIEPDVDLALLKAESGTYSTLSFAQSMTPTLGEDIFTIGFPMPDIQGFSPKMTKGVISSLNGIQDEDLEYQIDASIQPGNSGGPLVNNNGELVGVIVSSLRDSYIAEKKGIIPQNVNYAIKAKHVIDFLGQVPDCHKQITFSNQPKIQTSATPETIENVQSACAMVMVFE